VIDKLKDPKNRVRMALFILGFSLIGWPLTHVLMLITRPPGASSWVFHLLLALSWLAITFTCVDIAATTDTRRKVEE
jgi:hypothetical protein